MTESKKPVAPHLPVPEDEAPDLTESPWADKLAAASVLRERPTSTQTEVSTTIQPDADVLDEF